MGRRRALLHLKRLLQAPRLQPPSPPPSGLVPLPCLIRLLRTTYGRVGASSLSKLRFFSTNPVLDGRRENSDGATVGESQDGDEVVHYIPVKAYFLSTSIDLKGLQAENANNVIPPTSRSSNCVALRYTDYPPEVSDIAFKGSACNSCHVVVYQYGSVVLFNIADHEAEEYLDRVRAHACGLLPEMRKDDYGVVEKPLLDEWMEGGLDYIVLKCLDIDGIRIIGNVLGQSIALDHYIKQVDDMVEEFTDINRGMEKTGTFTMERKKLFHLVGRANSNLADVIIKLGLFDRSEIAWKNANYAQILEYLREEYELTQRFGSLDYKLKFVEHNIHFLQEVLQDRRSNALDRAIVVLLIIETILTLATLWV